MTVRDAARKIDQLRELTKYLGGLLEDLPQDEYYIRITETDAHRICQFAMEHVYLLENQQVKEENE